MRPRLLVVIAAVLLLSACTSVFFQPMRQLVRTPADIGLAYEDVRFPATDGVALHGWFLPAQGMARGTVVFLHGNAENVSTHIASVVWLPQRGFNVFLFDYRGYGASQGKPSLAGLQRDVDGALQWLRSRRDIDANRLVLFGQSLGGATALFYAAHHRDRFRAVVSESAFHSHRAIAREKLDSFWLTWPFQWPLGWAVDDDFSPSAVIDRIAPTPLLIVHGEQDYIVPPEHGRALYEAAREPKELWLVADAGHIETFRRSAYRDRLVAYLERQLAR